MFGILWVAVFFIVNLLVVFFSILVKYNKNQETYYFSTFRLILSILLCIAFILNYFF